MEEYYSSCFSEQDFSEECSYNSTNNIRIDIVLILLLMIIMKKRKDDYVKILRNEFLG